MAFSAGNFPEAEHYFVRALEYNPANPDAWLGRGMSAGWQSTPGQLRIAELQYALNQSLNCLLPEQYMDEVQRYADMALYQFEYLAAHMYDYAIANAWQPGIWEQFVEDMLQFIEAIGQFFVDGVNPANGYKIITELTRLLLTGIGYDLPDGRVGDHRLPRDLRNTLTQIREDAIRQLSGLDPSFVPNEVDKRVGDRIVNILQRIYG